VVSSIKLFFLGSPRLERDGQVVELQYRKNLALLAYLAVTGEHHTREALIALLWPELGPSNARANLRRNLSLLRQALGGDVLVVEGDLIGLSTEADTWVDADEFRRLLRSQKDHGHPEIEVCPDCLVALEQAVALYRGDFLAGFTLSDSLAFDDWQFFQSEGVRQELASALERLVRGHSAREAYEPAISYARRWLAIDPLHEPVHRQLMGLYAQSGRRAPALRQYEECARILEDELGLPPSRETTALYEQIRHSADPSGFSNLTGLEPPPQHNLPVQITPFVGRQAVLDEIGDRLQEPDCRLVSLVGPGGIGKTRLALEAAKEQLGRVGERVLWVPLAQVGSIEGMISAVAQATGYPTYRASDPWQQLLDDLHDERMLIVLDNLEHLLDVDQPAGQSAVGLINEILRAAPGVRILATSRARPNVQSECLLPVSGMAYPESLSRAVARRTEEGIGGGQEQDVVLPGHATGYEAVRLFLATARRVRPALEPTAQDLADVARICQLVEGMPLAILLAAAWMEMLLPAEIVAQLERGYGLLQADLRDLPARHRSLEAVFDASWRMLDDEERETFARLSVFRGGFTWEAAEQVVDPSLRTLLSLVHKSFLQRDAAGRYEIHELLRQYAERKLAEHPEERERIGDLHCAYYAQLSGQEGRWRGLPVELDNLRAGWRRAVNRARYADIAQYGDSFTVYLYQGLYPEAVSSLEWAVDLLRPPAGRAADGERGIALGIALIELGHVYQMRDPGAQVELRERLIDEGVSILRRLGARRELAGVAHWVAWTYRLERDADAVEVVEESLAFYREQGELAGVAALLAVLGELAIRRGAYDEAERLSREALRIGKERDDELSHSYASFNLAKIAYFRGEYRRAVQGYKDSLEHVEGRESDVAAAEMGSFLGDATLATGDYQGAREIHGRLEALWRKMVLPWSETASGQYYGLAYSLLRLGDIALALGEIARARECCGEARDIAREHPHVALNLDVVVSHAALLAEGGEEERAIALAALVLHHPSSGPELSQRAQQLIEQGEASLSPDALAAAQERGWAQDLETVIAELSLQSSD
jgi:DNA-binding SARP family transcriptional activator/predicted ATPase